MPYGIGGFPGLQSALGGNVNDMGDMFAQKQDDAQSEPWKIKTETDGTGEPKTTITAPHKDVLKLMDMLKYTEQAIQSMSQRDAQLQQREEALRKHPLMNVLSQVAGNLAVSDKRLPPIVAALGKTSLALNPAPDEIAAERMKLQKEIGTLGSSELRSSITALNNEARINQAQAKLAEDIKKHQDTVTDSRTKVALQAARIVAMKLGGPMTAPAFDAHMRSFHITDPEQIKNGYIAHQEEAALALKGKDKDTSTKITLIDRRNEGQQTLEDLKHVNRVSEIQTRFLNSISPSKFAFDQAEAKFKGDLRTTLAQDKALKTLTPKETGDLVAANQTDTYLDKVTTALKRPEIQGVTGPIFAATKNANGDWEVKLNKQAVLPRFAQSADRVQMEAMMQHEIPRIMSTVLNLQGGASILRSEEGRKMVAKLGAQITDRPDQILAILETVRDTNNDKKSALARAHPGVDWTGKYSPLIGLNNPNNARYFKEHKDSFGGTLQDSPFESATDDPVEAILRKYATKPKSNP